MQAEPLFALAVIFILIFPGTCAGAIKKRNHLGDSAGMVRIRRMISCGLKNRKMANSNSVSGMRTI